MTSSNTQMHGENMYQSTQQKSFSQEKNGPERAQKILPAIRTFNILTGTPTLALFIMCIGEEIVKSAPRSVYVPPAAKKYNNITHVEE